MGSTLAHGVLSNSVASRYYLVVLLATIEPYSDDDMSRPRFFCNALIGWSLLAGISLGDAFQAVNIQIVHPVLVGNEHNPLATLKVEVDEPGVRVQTLRFSFEGTDDLADLKNVQVFFSDRHPLKELDAIRNGKNYSGDRRAMMAELTVPFCRERTPTRTVEFRGDRLLAKGTNYFWLSCQLRDEANLLHKVDAKCTRIETNKGTVVPEDVTPHVRKRIGYALRKRYDDHVHTSRIPVLARTPQGTLLCAYDLRRSKRRDLQEDIDVGLSRSTDGGRTWEPMRVIMDMGQYGGLPRNRNGCGDAGLVVDQNTGEVFCAAVWVWDKLGTHQWDDGGSDVGFKIGESAQFLMVRSQDDGITWSEPENLTRSLKDPAWVLLAPAPQAGITLRDGTLVMLIEGLAEGDPNSVDHQKQAFSGIMTSNDHGKTWTVGSIEARGSGECQVVELRDGTLLMNSRTSRPAKYRSIYDSHDQGRSWQTHPTHRNTLIESSCNGSLINIAFSHDGQWRNALLFTNCHTQVERFNQMIQVSFDEGYTWPDEYHLLLDEGLGNGYPSLAQIDDEHIGIVYEGSQAHLVFEKIAISALLERGAN